MVCGKEEEPQESEKNVETIQLLSGVIASLSIQALIHSGK